MLYKWDTWDISFFAIFKKRYILYLVPSHPYIMNTSISKTWFSIQRFKKLLLRGVGVIIFVFWWLVLHSFFTESIEWRRLIYSLKNLPDEYRDEKNAFESDRVYYTQLPVMSWRQWLDFKQGEEATITLSGHYGYFENIYWNREKNWVAIPLDGEWGIFYTKDHNPMTGFIIRSKDLDIWVFVSLYLYAPSNQRLPFWTALRGSYRGKGYTYQPTFPLLFDMVKHQEYNYWWDCLQIINRRWDLWWRPIPSNVIVDECRVVVLDTYRPEVQDYINKNNQHWDVVPYMLLRPLSVWDEEVQISIEMM